MLKKYSYLSEDKQDEINYLYQEIDIDDLIVDSISYVDDIVFAVSKNGVQSNIVISKDVLYDKIWGFDNNVESNSIEAYISFIRKKFKVIGLELNIKAVNYSFIYIFLHIIF